MTRIDTTGPTFVTRFARSIVELCDGSGMAPDTTGGRTSSNLTASRELGS